MKQFIKSWFSLSTREIRGASVLIVLIILVLLAPYAYHLFFEKAVWSHADFIETIDKLLPLQNDPAQPDPSHSTTLFSFDPNTVGFNDMTKLGFSERQARTLINYRNAGGKFFSKGDLKKVYGMDEALYKQLRPYVAIAAAEKDGNLKTDNAGEGANTFSSKSTKTDKYKHLDLKVELNTATVADLILIPGIGPVYAKRIISYRDNLGGFYSSSQLSEVYGINDSLLGEIQQFLLVDTAAIQPLNLNTIDFRTLNNHPYVDYIYTKNIFKYKELMDTIINPGELLRNHLIDSQSYYKLLPYLSFE